MKSKYAIWVVCLLLFIAAVDTIPDPPAINPPGSHGCSVSAVHDRGPLSVVEREWLVASQAPQRILPNSLFIRLRFDDRPARICLLPRIHHATDTSPPAIA